MRTRTPKLVALAGTALLAGVMATPASATYTVVDNGDNLAITGDNAGDSLELVLDERTASTLRVVVNGSQIAAPPLSSFTAVQVRAGGGKDIVLLNDQHGPYGHQEQIQVLGQDGDDLLIGGAGVQLIDGGEEDDVIDGDNVTTPPELASDDDLRGGSGSDTFRWTPRDENDRFDGGTNRDRVVVDGDAADEVFVVRRNNNSDTVRRTPGSVLRPAGVEFRLDDSTEALEIHAAGGADQVSVEDDVTETLALDIDGGEGADVLTGGIGGDAIAGGPGVDRLSGRGGADAIVAGDGDDELDGGKGADTLDGGTGRDTFACGAEVDTLVFERGIDVIGADCEVPPEPAPEPEPEPGPAPQPDPAPQPQPDPAPQPEPEPGPGPAPGPAPAPAVRLGKPKVKGTLRSLVVTVRNTHTEAIQVKVGGSEKAGGRRFKHRGRTVLVAAGRTVKVTLKNPAALRALLERAARRRGRVVRRPTVTVATVDGAARATVKPRVALRVKRR